MSRLVTAFKFKIFTRLLDETVANDNGRVTWLLCQVKTWWTWTGCRSGHKDTRMAQNPNAEACKRNLCFLYNVNNMPLT